MPGMSAYEALERFHRDWLRGRASSVRSETGFAYPQVFVDGRPYGGVEAISQFGTDLVDEIVFISAPDATTRYGTGYPGGIIELLSRRRFPNRT